MNLGKQYETIGKLLGYKLASPHAPSIRYDSAYDRPPAETRRASILFRPALQAAASGHSASLRTMGYAVVGPVYEPPVLQLLQEHYNDLIGARSPWQAIAFPVSPLPRECIVFRTLR